MDPEAEWIVLRTPAGLPGPVPGGHAMRAVGRQGPSGARRPRISEIGLFALLCLVPCAVPAVGAEGTRRVLVLYPVNDRQPGILAFDQSLRATFASSTYRNIEIYNEYLDAVRFDDDRYQGQLAEFLRRKYAGRKLDVIIPALGPSLGFVLKHREELFPEVPVVFAAIEEREARAWKLGPGVVGVPMKVDLEATLEVALRLHRRTRRVAVVAGRSKTDSYWVAETREAFRGREGEVEFVYLTGLPMDDLLHEVSHLPKETLVYYLHVFEDGRGESFVPAEAVERLAAAASVPVYGIYHTYVGRGIVGGRVVRFEAEGEKAARLALRVFSGEALEGLARVEASGNPYVFDWRQLRRWGIDEAALPRGSVVLFKEASFWDIYRWRIIGVISLCIVEAVLIVGLLVERANRRRADAGLQQSQRELLTLTGRLLQAQESERRRIARELHDDLNQGLALLAVHLDLLGQKPPESGPRFAERMWEMSDRVRQLSSVVHGVSTALHPSKLEQLGLVATVRGLCHELARAHGLAIEFSDRSIAASIPGETALCLYRIVQEALSNIIKHSGARHAWVDLSGNEGGVALRVVDDGVGFDVGVTETKGGLGLVSMRERLRVVGGTIAIDARPSSGTRIDVYVPLARSGGLPTISAEESPYAPAPPL
jgi:signal transduction histidine kinase